MRYNAGEVITAMVTPFNEKLEVDYDKVEALAYQLVNTGSDAVLVTGTTGESPTLTHEEEIEILLSAKRAVGAQGKIIMGCGSNSTETAVKMSKLAEKEGADAILSVVPYYNKPSQQGLYNHFKAIAEHTPLPVILYNVPGRTSVNMTAAITLKLARDFENIIAIKEASGNFDQATAIISGMPKNFIFLSGDDGIALPLASIGASGVISVIANVMPSEFSSMLHLALEGEYGEARQIHLQLGEMFKALFEEGNPAGIKAALHARGVIACQKLRSPLCEVSEALYQKIKRLGE